MNAPTNQSIQRPGWATVVGILMIIFGGLGIFGGLYEMAVPYMMDLQTTMIDQLEKSVAEDEQVPDKITMEVEKDGETQRIEMPSSFDGIEKQFELPDWYKAWIIPIGGVSILIALLYLLSGVFLMMIKPFAVKFAYSILGVSIAWSVARGVFYASTGSMMIMAQIPGEVFSLVIDIALLIVVAVGRKDVFKQLASAGDSPANHA